MREPFAATAKALRLYSLHAENDAARSSVKSSANLAPAFHGTASAKCLLKIRCRQASAFSILPLVDMAASYNESRGFRNMVRRYDSKHGAKYVRGYDAGIPHLSEFVCLFLLRGVNATPKNAEN